MYKYSFIVLLVFIGLSSCKNNTLTSQNLTSTPVIRNVEEGGGEQASQTTNTSINKPEKLTIAPSPTAQRSRYYIIVRSYKESQRAQAESYVKKLKEQANFPAEIIEAAGRLRISIDSFDSEQEAHKQRDVLRNATDFQGIWVLKKP